MTRPHVWPDFRPSRTTHYRCDCGATRKFVQPDNANDAPAEMVCGWRGCEGTMRRASVGVVERDPQ